MDMVNNVLIEVMASIAEQERRMIKERQAEGIAVAKKNGKCLGRQRTPYPKNWEEVYREWKAGNITAVMAMDNLKLKRVHSTTLSVNGKTGTEFRFCESAGVAGVKLKLYSDFQYRLLH